MPFTQQSSSYGGKIPWLLTLLLAYPLSGVASSPEVGSGSSADTSTLATLQASSNMQTQSTAYFFQNFYADGDAGQCNGGAYGTHAAPLGQWTPAMRLDTDNRGGGCYQQFSIFDPSGLLNGLLVVVDFYPDGDRQCDFPGPRYIPVGPSLHWSSPYRIDTDNRSGGCQQVFSIYGRYDVELDVAFWADGDAGQCGNAGFHTVTPYNSVRIRLDMDNRPGGCRQMFRLRKLW